MLQALTGPFHGWRIVAAAATIQFLLGALQSQSFGLYIASLAHEMGWSRTSLAGAAALMSVEAALVGPMLGWLLAWVAKRLAGRRAVSWLLACRLRSHSPVYFRHGEGEKDRKIERERETRVGKPDVFSVLTAGRLVG